MPSVLLIRHAQASFGAADYDVLSETGQHQVRALITGLQRRGVRATRVVCGDLRRQRDTAAPCAEAMGAALAVDGRWNEYADRDVLAHHASVPAGLERQEGDAPLSSREFQEILNEALSAWIEASERSPCSETWPAFRARLEGALRDLAGDLGKGETAVAVSSGGAIAAICAQLMELPPQALIAFNHVSINTAICKLAVGRGGVTLVSINEHAHLDEVDGSLVTYR
jgi:broad specificity phosphatase PhoE